jgi:putative ABC transport system substrate-binding protein
MLPELAAKQLELLRHAVPNVSRVAVLWNAASRTKRLDMGEVQHAARALGVTLQSREVRNVDDFDGVFVAIKRERPDALLTLVDPVTFAQRNLIAEFAARERLPAMYAIREFVEAGGLMSYGVDLRDLFRRGATYVDKILKGAKPGDLPIEQTTKFELVINLKTAKAPRPDDPAIALDVLRFDCRHSLEPISAPTDQQPTYWTELWPGTGKEGGATSLAWP